MFVMFVIYSNSYVVHKRLRKIEKQTFIKSWTAYKITSLLDEGFGLATVGESLWNYKDFAMVIYISLNPLSNPCFLEAFKFERSKFPNQKLLWRGFYAIAYMLHMSANDWIYNYCCLKVELLCIIMEEKNKTNPVSLLPFSRLTWLMSFTSSHGRITVSAFRKIWLLNTGNNFAKPHLTVVDH
jgi:hypothetical protein